MATLLALIGNRDPQTETGLLGPVRMITEVEDIDRAYLFATADDDIQRNAVATRDYIRDLQSSIDAHKVDIDPLIEPVDVDALQRWFERTLPDFGIEGDVHVMASSGTPQMRIALTTVAAYLYPAAEHWQALDPRYSAKPYLRSFDPDLMRRHSQTAQALDHLDRIETGPAEALFRERAERTAQTQPAAHGVFRAAAELCAALNAADDLMLNDANAHMTQAMKAIGDDSPNLAKKLALLASWYEHQRDARRPWELLASAERMQARGTYSAALMRAAIAYEVGLAHRLVSQHKINPNGVAAIDAGRINRWAMESGMWRGDLIPTVGNVRKIEGIDRMAKANLLLDANARTGRRLLPAHAALVGARNTLAHKGRGPTRGAVDASLTFVAGRFSAWQWNQPPCPTRPGLIRTLVPVLRTTLRT